MTAVRPRAARALALTPLLAAAALGVSACGSSGPRFSAPVRAGGAVPLPAGTHVALDVRRCDPGAHAYCARQLVLVGARRPTAAAAADAATTLMATETALLHRAHWAPAEGEGTAELLAQSPHNRIAVTYASTALELKALANGDVSRAPAIVHVLRRAQTQDVPALSLMVQAGVP